MSKPKYSLKVGDRVLEPDSGEYRTVTELITYIDGGVRLDRPIGDFRSWNEDALELILAVAE
jgi:hypothetical protein